MKIKINIEQITFLKFITLLLKPYRKWLIGYGCFAILLYALVPLSVFRYAWAYYNALLVFGLLLSFMIHEYAHIYMMKFYCGGRVRIECSLNRISITPEFLIEKIPLLAISLSGPLSCAFIGGIIFLSNNYLNHTMIEILAYIYLLHTINLVPPFGDGIMLLKIIR